MDNEQKKTRRGVLLLIALSTLAFFALGLFFAVMRERVPQQRAERIEALLASGDTSAARPLIERVDDEALAEDYLARCDYLDAENAFARGDWIAARELYAAAGPRARLPLRAGRRARKRGRTERGSGAF